MGTPVAAVPGGGSTFALRADTGDASGEIDLDWLAPDDNGAPITQYRYQWKSGGQNYSGGRSGTSTNTSATVSSLNDGTEYDFRVRATNSVGNGPNSDEASATPETPFTPPTDTVPDAPTALAGTPRRPLIVDWTWEVPNDNGGQRIEDYDHQWRYSGDAWAAANLETTEGAYRRVTIADTTNSVQARVRARNSVGVSGWAGTVTVDSGDLLSAPTQRHRFTSSQAWNWPYDDLERAGLLLFGVATAAGTPNNSRDIVLGNSVWVGGVSDGTTLWFISETTPDTAFAYTAATLARDASRDIALPSNVGWVGGVSDGTTLWFINTSTPDTAYAYNAATRAYDSSRNFTLGSGTWVGGVSDGTTLWFINSNTPDTAFAYNAATLARDASRDIALGSATWVGGVSDGTTLWFITSTNPDTAFAYTAATLARDASRDIALPDSGWQGGVSDGTTLWFITSTNPDTAYAYNAATTSVQVVTGGSTYTTTGDADGFVSEVLTGISNNQSFALYVDRRRIRGSLPAVLAENAIRRAVSKKSRVSKGVAAALHFDSYRTIGGFLQQNSLTFYDIRALQPDFFGGVAVNDHRARVNARFQDCQHGAGKLGNGLPKERPLRHLLWSCPAQKYPGPVCCLNRKVFRLKSKFVV